MRKNKTTITRLQTSSKAKSGSSKPKTQGLSYVASYSALKKGLAAQARELREALQRETATGEILLHDHSRAQRTSLYTDYDLPRIQRAL